MRSRMARPAPRRRNAFGVRIDFTSPCFGSSSFNAPQPSSTESSHAVQKVTSGARSFERSSACTLSGGESSYMFCRCSFSSAWTAARERSSISRRMDCESRSARIVRERADDLAIGRELEDLRDGPAAHALVADRDAVDAGEHRDQLEMQLRMQAERLLP